MRPKFGVWREIFYNTNVIRETTYGYEAWFILLVMWNLWIICPTKKLEPKNCMRSYNLWHISIWPPSKSQTWSLCFWSVASLINGQERLMNKFMTRENWFIKHVISEICQNLHMKQDHDSPFAAVWDLTAQGKNKVTQLTEVQIIKSWHERF